MARVMFIVQEELRCLHCINLPVGSTFTSIEADKFESAIAPEGQREAIASFEEIQAKLN